MASVGKSKDFLNGYTNDSSTKGASSVTDYIFQLVEVLCFTVLWTIQALYYTGENIYHLFYKIEPKSVKNDIVLITGTGHGIGRELALKYAKEGATIIGWDINKENNDRTMKEVNEINRNRGFGYIVDVSDADSVVNTAKLVEKQVGEVTILIANAGIMPCHPLVQHTRTEIRKIIDINVLQLFWLMEAFLPTMVKNNRGHIVAMSSIAGLGGFANLVPYCASKFAVRGFMESLHEELRSNQNNQIKFTTIYPFMVDTGLCKHPRIKLNTLMKLLNPIEVAHDIMIAQRTDVSELSLPAYLFPLQNFMRLLPRKSLLKFVDFLDSGIDSDLQTESSE